MADRPTMLIIGARGINGSEGGVEKFAEEFSKRANRYLDLSVTCLAGTDAPDSRTIKVIRARSLRFLSTDKIVYYLAAARLCMTRRFDFVFLLGINSAILSIVLRALFFRKTFIIARSGSIDYLLPKWGTVAKLCFRVSEQTLRFADLVISVSPGIHGHLAKKGIRSTIIRNGLAHVQPAVNGRNASTRPVVAAVGRVTEQKNYRVLIEAARLLPDVDVRIIGGADSTCELANLNAEIEAKGIRNVAMTGALHRSEVFKEMNRASVYVNCSVHEGMSNSVLEAIQHRLPLVLSDIEANHDLGLGEHFYFRTDDPNALAEKIRAACENPDRFIAPLDNFPSWDEVVDEILMEIGAASQHTRFRHRLREVGPCAS